MAKPYTLDTIVPTFVTGTKSASGDNTLIAAPGATTRLVIAAISLQNEGETALTMILKRGTTAFWRVLANATGAGLTYSFERGREWRLGANEALVLNLSAALAAGYSIAYYTEAV